jgi:hypothetical protein
MFPQVKVAPNALKLMYKLVFLINLAKLEKLIKAKDGELNSLNMLVKNGYEGNVKPKPKFNYKNGRYHSIKDGVGHYTGAKVNERKVVKGKEVLTFTKGGNLDDLMEMAHGVTPFIFTQVEKKLEAPTKSKIITHETSQSYTMDYMVTMDHNGKIMVKYVGAYTKKKVLRSVWVQRCTHLTYKDPNLFGYLNSKHNLFCRHIPPVVSHGYLIMDAQII